jgi:hypothetical protein
MAKKKKSARKSTVSSTKAKSATSMMSAKQLAMMFG